MIERQPDMRGNITIVDIEALVPQDHLLRKIEAAVDFNKIYPMVEEYYSKDTGRPSVDPVILFKMAFIQHLYGIRSMRQTVKEIEVNVAYRWFLHYDFSTPVPHFATVSYAFANRFPADVFENIFKWILDEICQKKFLRPEVLFVDGTHIKANANKKKNYKKMIDQNTQAYAQKLREEVDKDREEHDKKPLKDKDDGDNDNTSSPKQKEITVSTTDPESGLFHKGEHKVVFAYSANTACDANNYVVDFNLVPGNINDSTSFDGLYERLKNRFAELTTIVADAGYKTPWICKQVIDDGKELISTYTSPKGNKDMFRSKDFVYDEYNDWVICPNNTELRYSTTNREGRKVFKSNPAVCSHCPLRAKCTSSKNFQKVVEIHVWQHYLEQVEELRYTARGKELYHKRQETIERVFADGKEKHGMRYTLYKGLDRVNKWLRLKFAAMNLKKMALRMA